MTSVTHARVAASRGGRSRGWWAKAWLRAVEEAAYGEADLRRGRALARGAKVGAVTVGGGSFVAAVEEGDDAWTVSGTVGTWDDVAVATLVEIVAARSGRVTELLARLHARSATSTAVLEGPGPDPADDEADLDVGIDAVLRAKRLLELVARGDTAGEHLF